MTQSSNSGKKQNINEGYTPVRTTSLPKPDKLPSNGYTVQLDSQKVVAPPPRHK